MNVFSRSVAVVGALIFAAGCGSSNNGTVTGSLDGSVDGTAPGADGAPGPTSDGASDDSPTTTNPDTGAAVCGNGAVEGGEECDDGASNGTSGDSCTTLCQFVCIPGDPTRGDSACNAAGNPCLGTATCQANHTCLAGTPLGQGASCGTGKICNGGLCAQAVCGDGIVTTPEECDDGSNNGGATDGCTQSCTFVCLSTDPARNCTPADPCAGKGTCNDTTHLCAAGTPEGNGTICGGELADGGAPDGGTIDVCKGGSCVTGYCGDGVLEPGEQCDFGAGNGAGTGCESAPPNACKFSCTISPNSCTQPTDSCAGVNACTSVVVSGDTGQHCVQGSPLANGTPCGSGNTGTCQSGSCQTTLCGNGVLNTGEQCDFGAGKNLAGSGCEPDCQFSCQKTPTDTCQTNVCAANPTICTTVPAGVTGTSGQKCNATTELAACGDCSASGVCVSNQCAASRCGDGCVDSRIGETCEPPSTATCDASCHTIAAAVCGNGKREAGEQCDDSNTTNLDGCDSKCKFEQEQRAITVAINYSSDTFCKNDALGGAVAAGLPQTTLSNDLTTSVNSGATTIEFKFMGITDLSGTAQSSGLAIGALTGTPATAPAGVTYNGASDLDWWYTTLGAAIDGSRNPVSQTSATFASKVLSAKNGSLSITISVAGSPATLAISNATIQANVGATSKPTVSTGPTPGHLAAENLDPTLVSFGSMNNGLLCGDISAASLATVAVPTALQTGTTACTNVTFGAGNSLLDVFVVGCSAFGGFVPIIAPTQPDQPPSGTGGTYTLSYDSTTHHVNGCKTGTTTVPLATCLAAASYSSYFGFTSDRVIAK